jgi:hypothetical protein
MLGAALEADVEAYLERYSDARDDRGHALVVRNGHARPRNVIVGAGAIEARAVCSGKPAVRSSRCGLPTRHSRRPTTHFRPLQGRSGSILPEDERARPSTHQPG